MDKFNVWDDVWKNENKLVYPNHIVIDLITKLGIKNVIELGGGSGNDIIELNNHGLDVVYSDNSLVAIDKFKKKTNNKIKTIKIDVLGPLPYKSNSFDLVYSLGLLEHFNKNQRKHIIREMFRISKRYVLIDVPQKYSLFTPVKKLLTLTGKWKYGWETEFSYGQLINEIMEQNNCKVRVKYGRGFLPLPRYIREKFYKRLLTHGVSDKYLKIQRKFSFGMFNCIGVLLEKRDS